jgi:two-component system, OmpR family, phosphate regulon response regulator PhoB
MALVYYLTPVGNDVLAKDAGSNFPLDYRRALDVIKLGGHIEVIRGRLRRFPDRLIEEWLKELVDLKMIEARPAKELEDFTLSGQRVPLLPPLADEDVKRLARATVVAGATLLRSGSFLADERIANLAPVAKAPAQTLIFLVEDDPSQRTLAELRLQMAGYRVRGVGGAKALSCALREETRPDLLLLDVMLPDGDGFEILAQLRAWPEFATLPIVLLTAKAELGDIRKGLALGADGYLTKPYSKDQLAEVIGRVLKQAVPAVQAA